MDPRLRLTGRKAKGVERTTLADVAQAADVPVGNVYYYFKTKDEPDPCAVGQPGAFVEAAPRSRSQLTTFSWRVLRELAASSGVPSA
jgi:TetR/AcrR family transcriptional regulator, transcriptional repressor for nem operon